MSGVLIRSITTADWASVESIYREGIATGNATFETDPPTWPAFHSGKLTVGRFVAEDTAGSVLGWVAASPVSSREAYRGMVEHSVYVANQLAGTASAPHSSTPSSKPPTRPGYGRCSRASSPRTRQPRPPRPDRLPSRGSSGTHRPHHLWPLVWTVARHNPRRTAPPSLIERAAGAFPRPKESPSNVCSKAYRVETWCSTGRLCLSCSAPPSLASGTCSIEAGGSRSFAWSRFVAAVCCARSRSIPTP